MNKNKQKLEELQRENERLVQKFWMDFYETKKILNKSFELIKDSEINQLKGAS